MPYLKNKVAKALEKSGSSPQTKLEHEEPVIPSSFKKTLAKNNISVKKEEVPLIKTQTHAKKEHVPHNNKGGSKKDLSNKNIVKNYARAMINFALSVSAIPYLNRIIKDENTEINLNEFRMYMQEQKDDITSIRNLRKLLLTEEDDSEQIATFKRVFKAICVIFVKFFSVNWIYSSKIGDKLTHVKYRFKILRRVKNPENFTYLENFIMNR